MSTLELQNENKQNINAFLNAAQKIKESKLDFNKDFIKNNDFPGQCFELASKYLERDITAFIMGKVGLNTYEIRDFIRNNLGVKALEPLTDNAGNLRLDMQHALVFVEYVKSVKNITTTAVNQAIGIACLITGSQLHEEFQVLLKACSSYTIQPSYTLSPNFFEWKRCPYILRKYSLYLTKPKGYKAYYFEKANCAQLAYLTSLGMSYSDASNYLKGCNTGLFFNYLHTYKENLIIEDIVNDGFCHTNGPYANSYLAEYEKLLATYADNIETYNIFNKRIKPLMMSMMGFVIKGILAELAETRLADNDAYIYHVSPYRVGVAIKENLKLEDLLPTLGGNMKPVSIPDLASLLRGVYL
jgi:hypothetical protein